MIALLLMALMSGGSEVSVRLLDKVQFAPGAVKLTVTVEQDPRNRFLCIEYDGGDYSRSCEEMNGEKARRIYQKIFRGLSEGEYIIAATVYRNDGTTAVGTERFKVIGASTP